ncbi:hypothetical protein LCM4577_23770 [Mesorhizobium sp. LCM 4577]|nr:MULTISPECIES: hypothetical protein [unclassified Mesorhizobium]OHV66745.1 hypothetical protein LCM4576_25815 [Mesorhizobium sp. LCM 4576]OHV69087.1 hypothetical protein LCM4577_23770 [Mesorhizobium sp. LCM 4577]
MPLAAVYIQQKGQVRSLFASRLSDPARDFQMHLQDWGRARDDPLARLDTIDDEFCPWFAARQFTEMCHDGSGCAGARTLLAGGRDRSVREDTRNEFPILKPAV